MKVPINKLPNKRMNADYFFAVLQKQPVIRVVSLQEDK